MTQENNQMTIHEMQVFFNHLCFSECSWEYVTDGLTFVFSTIEKEVAKDQLDSRDFINEILKTIFIDVSKKGQEVSLEYVENVAKRFRGIEETEEEIKPEPNVLDLSDHPTAENDCIDLARHLSSVMKDERTPAALSNAIFDAIYASKGAQQVGEDDRDSWEPEYIAKVLCAEVKNDAGKR